MRVRLVRKCQKIDMINVRCDKKCHCHMTKYQNAESQIYPLSNCQFRPMFYLKQEILQERAKKIKNQCRQLDLIVTLLTNL